MSYQPGDCFLVAGDSWQDRLIAWGQRLRTPGALYARWTHAGIIVNSSGTTIEAKGGKGGVRGGHISDYAPSRTHVVTLDLTDTQRSEIVFCAQQMAGRDYGWYSILSIGVRLVFGAHLPFSDKDDLICSALVAVCYESAHVIATPDPYNLDPADLAFLFHVL